MNTILLEVLRNRLDAICDEAGLAIERTAISPVVVESKDYGVMICDGKGRLITGAGATRTHFYAASHSISATLERHGDDIQAGDVFMANDPHNGGGLHPQDVFILQPVFSDEVLCAWVASTAHMMDMGGMVPGSFAPGATECYQEAVRFPPVLAIRDGVERRDVWDFLLNNIRLSDLVNIDLRGLIAGCHIAQQSLQEVVAQLGRDVFAKAVDDLCELTRNELIRRIEALEDGVYEATSWNEWNDETFVVPCKLTVKEGHLHFDFTGASPQAPHFFNSKPFIVKGELGVDIANVLCQDLPYNGGFFETFDVHCPEQSILNCSPPAPVGFGHVEVSFNAVEVGIRALIQAVAASEDVEARRFLSGPAAGSASALHTWAGLGLHGQPDGWLMMDGGASGASGANDRDGNDLFSWMVSDGGALELPDIEVVESWYPIEIETRRIRKMSAGDGAGCYRAGAGLEIEYKLSGTDALFGTIFANRCRIPLIGTAGGYPGARNVLSIRSADGSVRPLSDHESGFSLLPGEQFVLHVATGGGYGDPLDRDPASVESDLQALRIDEGEALEIYGVVAGDPSATEKKRADLRAKRLEEACGPLKPCGEVDESVSRGDLSDCAPLYPGIVRKGGRAISEKTGSVLAAAPDHWTDGCPQLRNFLPTADGVEAVGYLDPADGSMLFVDVVVDGVERSFSTMPDSWTQATHLGRTATQLVA
ncbi:MAG: hydantoinase B/oxoprolinase family protein [Gammaproteobacteria bacterium]|nr:hydantoinase B/oxoprolinase family protein [Gammaproteobacteria bacterium]